MHYIASFADSSLHSVVLTFKLTRACCAVYIVVYCVTLYCAAFEGWLVATEIDMRALFQYEGIFVKVWVAP